MTKHVKSFPSKPDTLEGFALTLHAGGTEGLVSQIAISSPHWGAPRYIMRNIKECVALSTVAILR
jgi:hypothetical protein